MSYKEKLRELLKTVPKLKKQMESLEFWTEILFKYSPDTGYTKYLYISNNIIKSKITENIRTDINLMALKWWQWLKIIWNPLQERFLRMFCEVEKIKLEIQANWVIKIVSWIWWRNEIYEIVANLDNDKDFDNQDEKTYKYIYETLYNFKK